MSEFGFSKWGICLDCKKVYESQKEEIEYTRCTPQLERRYISDTLEFMHLEIIELRVTGYTS